MCASPPVLPVQPLAQPMSSMVVHRPIGPADRAKAKIVAPAAQGAIELPNFHPDGLPIGVPSSHLAEFLTEGAYPLSRRPRPNEGSAALRRIASSQGVAQKVKALLGHPADARLLFVDRQLELAHHGLHLLPGLCRLSATKDDEVARVNHQSCFQLLLPTQLLPPQPKSPHVEVAQQWRDWRTLRCASPAVFGDGGSAFAAPFVVLLHGRLQPRLDEPEHGSVADASGHTSHQLVVWNRIEVAAQIAIDHLAVSSVE